MRAWRAIYVRARDGQFQQQARRRFSSRTGILYGPNVAEVLRNGTEAETVSVNGWVKSIRKQKRVAFAAVNDGSCINSLQAVLKPEDAAKYAIRKHDGKCGC